MSGRLVWLGVMIGVLGAGGGCEQRSAARPVFMKVQAQPGYRVVFLCDASGSMMTKFDTLRGELRKAIDPLPAECAFNVVFFTEDGYRAMKKDMIKGTVANKRAAYDFLDRVSPHGSSDPIPGMRAGFALRPEILFFVTDGDFPDNKQVLSEFRRLNADKKVKVYTIAMIDRGEEYEQLLSDVAKENGGEYRLFTGQ